MGRERQRLYFHKHSVSPSWDGSSTMGDNSINSEKRRRETYVKIPEEAYKRLFIRAGISVPSKKQINETEDQMKNGNYQEDDSTPKPSDTLNDPTAE